MAIAVLNDGLRPFLNKWHPRLQAWPENEDFLAELEPLRRELEQYAKVLADIARVSE